MQRFGFSDDESSSEIEKATEEPFVIERYVNVDG